ncbi:MAG: hypothetical protein J3K34DRAFT_444308 [Monoraphidium minutum]|nr:MAG: hypothetical protein J3K34DRAFT_444308 [Monoraphidium minutum]
MRSCPYLVLQLMPLFWWGGAGEAAQKRGPERLPRHHHPPTARHPRHRAPHAAALVRMPGALPRASQAGLRAPWRGRARRPFPARRTPGTHLAPRAGARAPAPPPAARAGLRHSRGFWPLARLGRATRGPGAASPRPFPAQLLA